MGRLLGPFERRQRRQPRGGVVVGRW